MWGCGFGLLGGLIGAKAGDDMDKVQQFDLSELDYFQKIQVIRKLSEYKK